MNRFQNVVRATHILSLESHVCIYPIHIVSCDDGLRHFWLVQKIDVRIACQSSFANLRVSQYPIRWLLQFLPVHIICISNIRSGTSINVPWHAYERAVGSWDRWQHQKRNLCGGLSDARHTSVSLTVHGGSFHLHIITAHQHLSNQEYCNSIIAWYD